MPGYDRRGVNNPKWRGGISSVKVADQILDLPEFAKENVKRRFELLFVIAESDPFNGEGCWTWTGGVFKVTGRAKFILGGNILAARAAYVLYKGSTNGLCVLHTCDNISCVNPNHLFLGTNADNSADMVAKGRQPAQILDQDGSKNRMAKLSEEDVGKIRARLAAGVTQRQLAKEFGVTFGNIHMIAVGKTWRHVNVN